MITRRAPSLLLLSVLLLPLGACAIFHSEGETAFLVRVTRAD